MKKKSTIVVRDDCGRSDSVDWSGKRIGKLTVLYATKRRANGYTIWVVKCDCGKIVERASYCFRRGTRSCGCVPGGRRRIENQGAHFNLLFATYRKSAKQRGKSFRLPKEQFRSLVLSACHYCGRSPSNRKTHNREDLLYNGIDRLNNAAGYNLANCVPCCAWCNRAKGVMSEQEFLTMVNLVYVHRIKHS